MLLEKLQSLEDQIDSLPREDNAYGLIHNDFHPYNFMIDGDTITVFDFDDCIYGWYALDIAIAAAHAVWWGALEKTESQKMNLLGDFWMIFLQGTSSIINWILIGFSGFPCLWITEIYVPSSGGCRIGVVMKVN